jgi:hypothetical protein
MLPLTFSILPNYLKCQAFVLLKMSPNLTLNDIFQKFSRHFSLARLKPLTFAEDKTSGLPLRYRRWPIFFIKVMTKHVWLSAFKCNSKKHI